ncbi:MAG: C-terminal binding protein [Acidimicrobiales bacterium]
MSKSRVVLTDQVFPDVELERAALAEIDATLEVASGTKEDAIALAGGADALLNTYLPIDSGDLDRLGGCRIIARYGIGVDNIDVAAAAQRGIVVTNVPDYCIEEVASHALAMIMALLRKLPAGQEQLLAGAWGVDGLRPMLRPSEATAGLVGYGRIARHLAGVLRAMGMRILTYDPFLPDGAVTDAEQVDLDGLLEHSDVISLHCPLTEGTRGLIGAPQLARMRPGAVLVNTSRGPLVRFADLVDALRAGRIGGAGLDVFETEPPDTEVLAGVPGLLATPHSAFYSEAALRESQRKAVTQVIKVLRGERPDYPVAPPAGS